MNYQISVFDLITEETPLEKCLKRGSGYAGGQVRIMAAAESMVRNEFVSWLKEEFGIGGNSVENGFMDYSPKGIVIRKWRSDEESRFTWTQVAQCYYEMIAKGAFPDEKSLNELREIRKHYAGTPSPRMAFPPANERNCYGCRKYNRMESECRETGESLSGFTPACGAFAGW